MRLQLDKLTPKICIIDKDTAERLVIRGFLGAVITEIPVKEVRDEMIAVLDRKLENR